MPQAGLVGVLRTREEIAGLDRRKDDTDERLV